MSVGANRTSTLRAPRSTLAVVSDSDRAVIEGALRLPTNKRADLAADLIDSLDDDDLLAPEEHERLWTEEITRRVERAARGESRSRDAYEVLAEIEASFTRPR